MQMFKCDMCGEIYNYDIKDALKDFESRGCYYYIVKEVYPDSRSRKLDICPKCQEKLYKLFNKTSEENK